MNLVPVYWKICENKSYLTKNLKANYIWDGHGLCFQHLQRHQATKLFNTDQDASRLQGVTPAPVQHVTFESRPSTGFETVDLQFQVGADTPAPESRFVDDKPMFVCSSVLCLRAICMARRFGLDGQCQILIINKFGKKNLAQTIKVYLESKL